MSTSNTVGFQGHLPGQELIIWLADKLKPEDMAEFEGRFQHFLDATNTKPNERVTAAMDEQLRKLAPSVKAGNPAAVARYVALSKDKAAQANAESFNKRYPGAARIRVMG